MSDLQYLPKFSRGLPTESRRLKSTEAEAVTASGSIMSKKILQFLEISLAWMFL